MRECSFATAIRVLPIVFLTGCGVSPFQKSDVSRDQGFISYWPPAGNGTGLKLAVKDLIDMKGLVTSAGSEYLYKNNAPATRDAECLRIARGRNVQFVGKTNLTEFAITVSGKNDYFGTPVNRWDGKGKYIPGGSSSGSAVAVASGKADVAFGTDTGGSIRIPAACCGIYGLKTTYGLVSTRGVFPISPKHLDTVGPMAPDIPRLVEGMDLLQGGFAERYRSAVAVEPSAAGIRIGRLYLDGTNPEIDKAIDAALIAKGFKIIKLNDTFKRKWEQAEKDGETIALADAWRNDQKFADKFEISNTTRLVLVRGSLEFANSYKDAIKRKAAWQRDLRNIFTRVDFIATPTMNILPPRKPFFRTSAVFEWLVFNSQNTVAVNFAGNPALAMPIPMPARGDTIRMTSLQLVGPRLSEAALLNVGRLVASKN